MRDARWRTNAAFVLRLTAAALALLLVFLSVTVGWPDVHSGDLWRLAALK